MSEHDRLTNLFGEQYRHIIGSALRFLEDHEASWGLTKPIDRDKYIGRLLEAAHVAGE